MPGGGVAVVQRRRAELDFVRLECETVSGGVAGGVNLSTARVRSVTLTVAVVLVGAVGRIQFSELVRHQNQAYTALAHWGWNEDAAVLDLLGDDDEAHLEMAALIFDFATKGD